MMDNTIKGFYAFKNLCLAAVISIELFGRPKMADFVECLVQMLK